MAKTMNQRTTIVRSLYYWFKAYVSPKKVIDEFKSDSDKLLVSFWINLIFSFLYALTALLAYLAGQKIVVDPWVPIAAESYYLYQFLWTIPWGLSTWVMLGGICHLSALVGKGKGPTYSYEDALLVVSISWVLPWFICAWLPETLILIPFGIVPPAIVEIVRLGVLAVVYQTMLIAIGLHRTHEVSWVKGILIGLISIGVIFVMFLAFLR